MAKPFYTQNDRTLMRKEISLIIILICGCIGQEVFTLTDITFCINEPFDRSYEQNRDATYVQGETVWIYFEAFRFETRQEENTFMAVFEMTLELLDSEGTVILKGAQHLDIPSEEEPSYLWFKYWIDTRDLEEGVYTVRITAIDNLSGESATSESTFSVVKG